MNFSQFSKSFQAAETNQANGEQYTKRLQAWTITPDVTWGGVSEMKTGEGAKGQYKYWDLTFNSPDGQFVHRVFELKQEDFDIRQMKREQDGKVFKFLGQGQILMQVIQQVMSIYARENLGKFAELLNKDMSFQQFMTAISRAIPAKDDIKANLKLIGELRQDRNGVNRINPTIGRGFVYQNKETKQDAVGFEKFISLGKLGFSEYELGRQQAQAAKLPNNKPTTPVVQQAQPTQQVPVAEVPITEDDLPF